VRTLRVADVPETTISGLEAGPSGERKVLSEKPFKGAIAIERKRTERSGEPFLLMLCGVTGEGQEGDVWLRDKIVSVLLAASRETDVVGWYTDRDMVGVLFTSFVDNDRKLILNTILNRFSSLLEAELPLEQFARICLSFHFFPDDWHAFESGSASNPALYPDLLDPGSRRKSYLLVKRGIDLLGSVLALIFFSPLFLLIALAIKLTSKGPVFFQQNRVGQFGRQFMFLKFRTMYCNCDSAVHREYVTRLIANQAERNLTDPCGQGIFKLTNDRRITWAGRILRRYSLDELPQLLNVLRGDMSLVGPRPAIPYELAAYQTWHRRRILEAKPGVTGLWQVTGRSQVRFDEMVRLDLRYATSLSLWLDLKILARTPLAVVRGAGAC
jgi:lipopolysaccharide/colanic/teichoic acid biosynthesis glycosyltransferase